MHDGQQTLTMGQAARELELRTGELELAIQLGAVRTVPAGMTPRPAVAHLRRRVPVGEIHRLRSAPDYPDVFRERLHTVGTTEAAALMGIGPSRFLRLTKSGCFTPVRFYVNRYGVLVWLYLASEVAAFADRAPELLHTNTPAAVRTMLDEGQDWRPRQWRGRRVAQLMGQAADAWEAAAVLAAVLPPEEFASVVPDTAERAVLRDLKPHFASVITATPAAREAYESVLVAEAFDEVLWYRVNLNRAVERARDEAPHRPRSVTSGPSSVPRRRRPAAPTGPTRPDRRGPAAPQTGRKRPSWTTETSSLPSRS
ncbi:DUF6397 family protein [Streptomyces catenulae]|uniref:DUF6397 family protein n=1 Tax=Streptomyces catenulae TaxID=66875 RepID=A0ABV2YSW0_9ACTN|nr:DUF6397 family protein [Streptomyces catenulae]